MRSKADEVRKRIAKRKRKKEKMKKNMERRFFLPEDEERYGFEPVPTYEAGPGNGEHPLFRKEIFIFKILTSASLVLLVAILFRQDGETFEPIKGFVKKSMEQDFRFAAITNWYENQFGKPLALLPAANEREDKNEESPLEQEYALPAAGRILEDFKKNGQNITIETTNGADVAAMNEGVVEFAGVKEGFGKTVIIQHGDNSETWYGNLDEINVYLYQFVEKGTKVGIASDSKDGTKGEFYFAIKKGENFIDPNQVIQFE